MGGVCNLALMKNNIQELLVSEIEASVKEFFPVAENYPEIFLDFPADERFGDLASNIALQLSKQLKKSPREIAAHIVENLQQRIQSGPLKDYIPQVKIEGAGFINFYLSQNYFYEYLQDIVITGSEALKLNLGMGKRVLIEFVSANPTGPLSVAHARQAAVGDILANILDFLKFKVHREYYLNDEGNQINILGKSVGLRLKELNGERIDFPEDHYQGEYIYDIARQIKEKKLSPDNLGDFAADYILNIIKKELADFGVKFDTWYSQKKLRECGKIKSTLDALKEKGFLYEQDGALWFRSTSWGDDKDRVIIKSDGSFTYLAPDIAYHEDKFKRGFQWLINLWGPDHHGYINRLKAAVQALGEKEDALSIIIVQLATIFRDGKPVQMSTRRGQYITLQEVLDEVGQDAARFFFIMRRTSSHLDFDLDIAKKQTSENPVYYVQYAHARISSVLRNAEVKIDLKKADLALLKEEAEVKLIKKLWQFPSTLCACLKSQDPYMLTVYLQELSLVFHKFYDQHRVLNQEEKLTQSRLLLLQATKAVITTGLDLIGVSKPEQM